MLLMHRNKFGEVYYTLLGGGVEAGETLKRALKREIFEESGFKVTSSKLVFIDKVGEPYGTQYIFLCEAKGDDPRLQDSSTEARSFSSGDQHTPVWLPSSS